MKKNILLILLSFILLICNLISVYAIDLKKIRETIANQDMGIQKSSLSTNEITCNSDKCSSLSASIKKKQKELDLDYEKINNLIDSIQDEKVQLLRQKVERYTKNAFGHRNSSDYTSDLKKYYLELIKLTNTIIPEIGKLDLQITTKENDLDKTKRELYSEYSKEFINQRRKEQNRPEIGKEKSVKKEAPKTTTPKKKSK